MFIARREAKDYFPHFNTVNYYINVTLKDNKLLKITADGYKCYSVNVNQQREWNYVNLDECELDSDINAFSIKKVFYSSNSVISKDFQLVRSIEVDPMCDLFISRRAENVYFDELISGVINTYHKQAKIFIEVYSIDDTVRANSYIDASNELIEMYKSIITNNTKELQLRVINKYIKKDFASIITKLKHRGVIESITNGKITKKLLNK